MVQFFIDRPVFAWVVAIIIMLAGATLCCSQVRWFHAPSLLTVRRPSRSVSRILAGAGDIQQSSRLEVSVCLAI